MCLYASVLVCLVYLMPNVFKRGYVVVFISSTQQTNKQADTHIYTFIYMCLSNHVALRYFDVKSIHNEPFDHGVLFFLISNSGNY